MEKKTGNRLVWLLALAAVGVVLFLTLQPPESTQALSRSFILEMRSFFKWLRNTELGRACGLGMPSWLRSPRQVRHWAHLPEYLLLGLCLWPALRRLLHGRMAAFFALLSAGALIALLDEGLKHYLPTREFDAGDLLLDLLGIALAALIALGLSILREKRRRNAEEKQ